MENMTFEEIVKRLEEIKNELNSDNVELEKLVDLYEEGKKLSFEAKKKLDDAMKRVNNLVVEDDEK